MEKIENERSWDGHEEHTLKTIAGFGREVDRPIAGLLADL